MRVKYVGDNDEETQRGFVQCSDIITPFHPKTPNLKQFVFPQHTPHDIICLPITRFDVTLT
jgi:hypothetical protein